MILLKIEVTLKTIYETTQGIEIIERTVETPNLVVNFPRLLLQGFR